MPLFTETKKLPRFSLADRFTISPFSVLRRTAGPWQERKKYWQEMGVDGGEGRDTKRYNALPTNIGSTKRYDAYQESVSTFDPTLCEVLYKWFSSVGDKILDPFAGGSVRGIVASALGRKYTGIDLSSKQVIANQNQYDNFQNVYANMTGLSEWIVGDSEYALDQIEDGTFDMLFTCPPYYNLEQYTRDPRDLSRQDTYEAFLIKYTSILNKAVGKLNTKSGAYAVIVVGEVRNPSTGTYYGLVPDTINILRQAGLHYYNELILEDEVGSLAIRGPKYFKQSRKIGKMHQNILVFYAGDISKIREKTEYQNISNNFLD